jgi:hypothetical protein
MIARKAFSWLGINLPGQRSQVKLNYRRLTLAAQAQPLHHHRPLAADTFGEKNNQRPALQFKRNPGT